MARYIKANGSTEEVHPAGRKFTNDELYALIDGPLTILTLINPDQGKLFVFMDDTDDEHDTTCKPINYVATELLHQYQPHPHITVRGDAVVAGLDETGDE